MKFIHHKRVLANQLPDPTSPSDMPPAGEGCAPFVAAEFQDVSLKGTEYMRHTVILLRISYWLGAVLDASMIVPMLVPRVGGAMFGLEHFAPAADYRYAMMIGASLMLGWTILLIWADK